MNNLIRLPFRFRLLLRLGLRVRPMARLGLFLTLALAVRSMSLLAELANATGRVHLNPRVTLLLVQRPSPSPYVYPSPVPLAHTTVPSFYV